MLLRTVMVETTLSKAGAHVMHLGNSKSMLASPGVRHRAPGSVLGYINQLMRINEKINEKIPNS